MPSFALHPAGGRRAQGGVRAGVRRPV